MQSIIISYMTYLMLDSIISSLKIVSNMHDYYDILTVLLECFTTISGYELMCKSCNISLTQRPFYQVTNDAIK